MSSFLFQNTSQLTLLGMHQCSHVVPQTFKSYCSVAVKVLGMHHYMVQELPYFPCNIRDMANW